MAKYGLLSVAAWRPVCSSCGPRKSWCYFSCKYFLSFLRSVIFPPVAPFVHLTIVAVLSLPIKEMGPLLPVGHWHIISFTRPPATAFPVALSPAYPQIKFVVVEENCATCRGNARGDVRILPSGWPWSHHPRALGMSRFKVTNQTEQPILFQRATSPNKCGAKETQNGTTATAHQVAEACLYPCFFYVLSILLSLLYSLTPRA